VNIDVIVMIVTFWGSIFGICLALAMLVSGWYR
jgi:hypothetical protein